MSYSPARQTPIEGWADPLGDALTYRGVIPPPAVQVYRQTASTQDIARQHAGAWFVALADQQTAGRGRLGRAWVAPAGSAVLMSLCWPGLTPRGSLDTVAYRVAVAVAKAVEPLIPGAPVRIKWPNDIVVEGRKLAGILIERADASAIIGIGLNVTLTENDLSKPPPPPEPPPERTPKQPPALTPEVAARLTSLAMLGGAADRLRVAASLIEQCYRHLADPHEARLLDAWRSRSPRGYAARFQNNGEEIAGTVMDLDPEAGLIVRRDSGEIVHLPAATTTVLA